MPDQVKRTPAEAAKFHVQFAVQMLNCDRYHEANVSFNKAIEFLDEIIASEVDLELHEDEDNG